MGMTIKSDETQRLIRELAELTGESQTAAVDIAVRERLARLRQTGPDEDARLERMTKIAREAATLFREPHRSVDHGELLYDENGLPR